MPRLLGVFSRCLWCWSTVWFAWKGHALAANCCKWHVAIRKTV